jgi:acetoacetyl-CoA synthetase
VPPPLPFPSPKQENVAACLATAALGGIWVSAAADFGSDGVLERCVISPLLPYASAFRISSYLTKAPTSLEQVKPTFLFAIDAVV